jgi:protein phosphatase
MGSRAVAVVCRDESTATQRFGVKDEGIGIVYTRTGRRFFNRPDIEQAFLERIGQALSSSKFWDEFETDWVCLDCELMPWSEKAQELLKEQYAAVGAAAKASLSRAIHALSKTAARSDLDKGFELPPESDAREFDIETALSEFEVRRVSIDRYIRSYQQYCWPVNSLEDLKIAPFHLLATEGRVYTDKDHEWHMQTLAGICSHEPRTMLETPYRIVDVTDETSLKAGVAWWEELTDKGVEGIVIKPFPLIARGKKGLVQPALKCRGREYLRIIYGAEYTAKENLERLRSRFLARKRSLAIREFALGIEALERFARKEPLRRVHECVFGVLALESEPVDPRL